MERGDIPNVHGTELGASRSQASDLLSLESVETRPIDWARKNIVNPALNAGVIEPVNAIGNVINAVARPLVKEPLAGKIAHLEVPEATFLSASWFGQSLAAGLGSIVPYAFAGKLAASSYSFAGAQLNASGLAADVLHSRAGAAISGAAFYDFVRDTRAQESHFGNAVGGASGFAVFELGNYLTSGTSGPMRVLSRAAFGSLGASLQLTSARVVSTGELPQANELLQSAIAGSVMNNLLPLAQERIQNFSDQTNLALGRGIPLERFRGQSPQLDALIDGNRWGRVQTEAKFDDYSLASGKISLQGREVRPENLARELTRLSFAKSSTSDFSQVTRSFLEGRVLDSWNQFRDLRVTQEVAARSAENRVAFDEGRATSMLNSNQLKEEIGAWPAPGGMSQEMRWRVEFNELISRRGDFIPGMKLNSNSAFSPEQYGAKSEIPPLEINPGTDAFKMEAAARKAVSDLQRRGEIALYTGGSVREEILGALPKDYDIATSAKPEVVEKLFRDQGYVVNTVGKQFGTIKVLIDGHTIEVSTLRSEGNYSDGRRPDFVSFISSLREDAARRDFTMNAIYKDPLTNTYYDFFSGKADIANRTIRAVGNASERFAEDPLRMLRLARFSSKYSDFKAAESTFDAVKENADLISSVKGERVAKEMGALLDTPKPSVGLQFLMDSKLMHRLFPEVIETDGPRGAQDARWHPEGNTWTHQKMVTDNLAAGGHGKDFVLMLSGFTHDMAKPVTQKIWPDGGISNYKHDAIGAEMTKPISERLRMSSKDAQSYFDVVQLHMKVHDAQKMRPGKLWELMTHPEFDRLRAFQHADSLGTLYEGRFARSNKTFFENKLVEMQNPAQQSQKIDAKPIVDGNLLIEMGFPKSRIRSEIIAGARLAQHEGLILNLEQGRQWVQENYGNQLNLPQRASAGG